jgi:hypothetical protein
MELSIYLAKLIGLYVLIVAADLIFRRHEIKAAVKDFCSSTGLVVFSGALSLLMGLAIVIAHPVYESGLEGSITVLGYLIILRGVWRMVFPSRIKKHMAACFRKGYWSIVLIMVALGIYLTYSGFTAVY